MAFEPAISRTKKALDYFGKKLELDIFYFFRGGFWLSAAYLLNAFTAFFVVFAFTRLTSKEFYGQYQFLLAIIATSIIFSLPGMKTAIVQSVSRGKNRALIQCTKVRFRWSFLGSLALFLIAGYFKYFRTTNFWYVFVIAAVLFPFLYSFDGTAFYFLGTKQFKKAAILSILPSLLGGLAVLMVLFLTNSIVYIVSTHLLVLAIFHTVVYGKVRKTKLEGEDPDVFHYGFHLSLVQAVQVVGYQIDKLIVPYFLGFEHLATYAVASVLPEGLKGLMKLSSSLLLPKFSILEDREAYKQFESKLRLVVLIAISTTMAGIALTPIVIPMFFTPVYKTAVPYAQLLFASLVLSLPGAVFQALLQARKRVRAMYRFNILFSVCSILFMFALIPHYGLWGACLAKLLTRYISTLHLWSEAKSA